MEAKEENKGHIILESYVSQTIPTDSHNTTIHSSQAKGRLSLGLSKNSSTKRRVIKLQKENKEELPVLGHACKNQ